MFTSIPYTSGWTAYVDGKQEEKAGIGANGLIGVPVPEGTHEIMLKYKSPFLLPAFLCTLLGPILFILYRNKTTGGKTLLRKALRRKIRGGINTGKSAAGKKAAGRNTKDVKKTSGITAGSAAGKIMAGRNTKGGKKKSGIMAGGIRPNRTIRNRLMAGKKRAVVKAKVGKETVRKETARKENKGRS